MLSIDLTTTTSLLRVLMFCAATLVGASVGASSAHAITIQEVKSKGGITAWQRWSGIENIWNSVVNPTT